MQVPIQLGQVILVQTYKIIHLKQEHKQHQKEPTPLSDIPQKSHKKSNNS